MITRDLEGGRGAQIICPNCKEEVIVGLPKGWAVNLVGILQVIHVDCGKVLNFGMDKIVVDSDSVQRMQDEQARERQAGRLLAGVEENKK